MKRYYIKFSGVAWDIEGETPEAAIKQIRHILDVFSTIVAYEIGVDVDELGYPIEKGKEKT